MWPFNRFSLFWKIFLWFWMAMLFIVAISVVGFWLSKDTINFYPIDRGMSGMINKVAKILESDMPKIKQEKLLKNLLRNMAPAVADPDKSPIENAKHKDHLHYLAPYLLYEKGVKVDDIPEPAIALWKRYKKKPYIAIHKDMVYVGPKLIKIEGKVYVLFLQQHIGRFKFKMFRHFWQSISIWQVVGYFAISLVLCFLLAWSFTRPIKKLQSVTQRVARGERVSAREEIGDRKDEFYSLAADFDQMSDKILSSVDSQKRLLSDVSHELRSPLARIHLALGLLSQNIKDSDINYIERIEKECETMDGMIGQLLNIAALERGQIFEQKQSFELCELLKNIADDAAFEATSKEVLVDLACLNDIQFQGYYQLLRSAIENVIRNAIRYTAKSSTITICLEKVGENAVITVCDEGEGVNQVDLPRLFEAFYRTDKARSRSRGGSGLGLAITRRSIQAHKGEISAANHEPTGLCVIITLPLN